MASVEGMQGMFQVRKTGVVIRVEHLALPRSTIRRVAADCLWSGRAAHVESIQVLEGRPVHGVPGAAVRRGLQHLGFWCPDVRAAVTRVVTEGVRVVCAFLQSQNRAVTHLTPSTTAAEVAQIVNPGRMAYIDPAWHRSVRVLRTCERRGLT